MPFKGIKNFFLQTTFWLVTPLIFLTACGRFFQPEDKSKQDPQKINIAALTCLQTVQVHVRNLMEDEATPDETGQLNTCLKNVLTQFTAFVHGYQPEGYETEELRGFLNKYVLKEQQIRPEFMVEIMKFKVFLIGGRDNFLSRKEVGDLITMFDVLERNVRPFLGHFKSLDVLSNAGLRDQIKVALLDLLEKTHFDQNHYLKNQYSYVDFGNLFREAFAYAQQPKVDEASMKELSSTIHFLTESASSFQTVALGDPNQQLDDPATWKSDIDWMADAFFLVWDVHEKLTSLNISKADDIVHLIELFQRTLDTLEAAPTFRRAPPMVPDGQRGIQAIYLDDFISKVAEHFLSKTSLIKIDVLLKAYKQVFKKFFSNDQGVGLPAVITQEHINNIREELTGFVAVERKIFQDLKIPMNGRDLFLPFRASSFGPDEAISEWNLLSGHRNPDGSESYVLTFLEDGRLVLDFNLEHRYKNNLYSWTMLNFVRELTRLVLVGYGTTRRQANFLQRNYVDVASLTLMERDFHDIGMELEFLDGRTPEGKAAPKTFSEADTFTPHANGNERLEFQEIAEEISMMMSVGRNISTKISDDLSKPEYHALEQSAPDAIFHRPIFQEKAFEQFFVDHFEEYFASLPRLVDFYQRYAKQNPNALHELYGSLRAVARKNSPTPDVGVQFTDIRSMAMIAYYVESTFLAFDRNHDGVVSGDEIDQGFYRVRNLILKTYKQKYSKETESPAENDRWSKIKKGSAKIAEDATEPWGIILRKGNDWYHEKNPDTGGLPDWALITGMKYLVTFGHFPPEGWRGEAEVAYYYGLWRVSDSFEPAPRWKLFKSFGGF